MWSSYGRNNQFAWDEFTSAWSDYPAWSSYAKDQIPQPSRLLEMVDSIGHLQDKQVDTVLGDPDDVPFGQGGGEGLPQRRHPNSAVNILYFDGHVGALNVQAIWDDRDRIYSKDP